jgi:hypothetical protein
MMEFTEYHIDINASITSPVALLFGYRRLGGFGHGAIDRAGFASGVGTGIEAPGGETESQCGAGASRDFEGRAYGDEAAAVGGSAGGDPKRGGGRRLST